MLFDMILARNGHSWRPLPKETPAAGQQQMQPPMLLCPRILNCRAKSQNF